MTKWGRFAVHTSIKGARGSQGSANLNWSLQSGWWMRSARHPFCSARSCSAVLFIPLCLGGRDGGFVVDMPWAIKPARAVITQVTQLFADLLLQRLLSAHKRQNEGCKPAWRKGFSHTSQIDLWAHILVHPLTGLLCSINAITGGRSVYCHRRCL